MDSQGRYMKRRFAVFAGFGKIVPVLTIQTKNFTEN
jgi:hypothetical protein